MAWRAPHKLGYDALREFAMAALARRAHSSFELREKLRKRAERAGDADTLIREFAESGLLDDARFAANYASLRLANQGFGKLRVLRDLGSRRVAPPTAEQAVGEAYAEVDESALIHQFLARKFRAVDLAAHLRDPRRLAAAYRRLRLAGFRSEASIRALKRYSQHADELEGTEPDE